MSEPLYYICDLRREWLTKPYVSFWRPNDAGYAYPLCWAGMYSLERIKDNIDYYYSRNTKVFTRFPVPCEAVGRFASAPAPKTIDNDAGPVLYMNKAMRAALRAAMLPLDAVGTGKQP